ncbi:transcription elongation factor GreB [Craurococcus roseus]|uniref:Transcription elongation factor GreB n=1 Tax=Craurococcus roseus TaxID=77585 RepID=A0ABN1ENH2_9PROT
MAGAPGGDEDEDDDSDVPPGLPRDAPFVMSPAGHAALTEEARRLWQEERPRVVEVVSWAASLGDRSENADYQYGKRRLREIDRRLRFLRKRLDRAQVVDPAKPARRDRVFFGATVEYAREDGAEAAVTIVGLDEADAGRGRISYAAPVARALLGASVGDLVKLRTPGGVEELEVLAIRYPEPGNPP